MLSRALFNSTESPCQPDKQPSTLWAGKENKITLILDRFAVASRIPMASDLTRSPDAGHNGTLHRDLSCAVDVISATQKPFIERADPAAHSSRSSVYPTYTGGQGSPGHPGSTCRVSLHFKVTAVRPGSCAKSDAQCDVEAHHRMPPAASLQPNPWVGAAIIRLALDTMCAIPLACACLDELWKGGAWKLSLTTHSPVSGEDEKLLTGREEGKPVERKRKLHHREVGYLSLLR